MNKPDEVSNSKEVPPPADDAKVLNYLVAPETVQYRAIMDVLESSITALMPREICGALKTLEMTVDEALVSQRLDSLHGWGAVTGRSDASKILRFADIMARNWRYTATPNGRQAHRFYRKFLANSPVAREIPLPNLARVVEAAEALQAESLDEEKFVELVSALFINHDDLDSALVGAEDNLSSLSDRFDLDKQSTTELKSLLVGYASKVAHELERGSARAYRALLKIQPKFAEFAQRTISSSEARQLIERGALTATHGGRVEDWDGILAWLNPEHGRAARFALRMVRALPGMHINLRRLHSSAGAATNKMRALQLAKACSKSELGPAIFVAVLGDHQWRKLYGEADDHDLTRLKPWREGPKVQVPEMLRKVGKTGARGKASPARDDSQSKEIVRLRREERLRQHSDSIREILSLTKDGPKLSDHAGRVALTSLMAAVNATSKRGMRLGTRDGLSCSLVHVGKGQVGAIKATTWTVFTPGRIPIFHLPSMKPDLSNIAPSQPEAEKPELIMDGA
ncbi:MAG: DUF2397 domain-containing protein [Bdellovibrionales bacterium]